MNYKGKDEFIPAEYVHKQTALFTMWHSLDELNKTVLFFQEVLEFSIFSIMKFLDYRFTSDIHICIYHSFIDAKQKIPNVTSSTQLFVPLKTSKIALIALFSPETNILNGNKERMKRHLIHEFTHVWLSEITGTHRLIGTGKQGNPIKEWLDEGIAELISLFLTGSQKKLENCLNYYLQNAERKEGEINHNLYKYGTGRVYQSLKSLNSKDIKNFVITNCENLIDSAHFK